MAAPADPLDGLRRRYIDALLAGNGRDARDLVEDAARTGARVEDLYLRVLEPALHEVGERWERGEVSVAQEHLATATTSAVLADLAARLVPGHRATGRALVCATPGERHALGGRMVADFLAATGLEVEHLAVCESAEAIAAAAERSRVDLVAVSTSLPWLLPEARRICVALKALPEPPRVIVGGRAYRGQPQLADLVGADGYAADPRDLLTLLRAEFVA